MFFDLNGLEIASTIENQQQDISGKRGTVSVELTQKIVTDQAGDTIYMYGKEYPLSKADILYPIVP